MSNAAGLSHCLEGKTAIVTGAGRGIGRATAVMFGAAGARVLVTDRDAVPVHETAEAIRTGGSQAHVIVADVCAPGFPAELVETTRRVFGGLDILVNNAGFTWDATAHRMTDAQWLTILDLHLTAPFRILRAASPLLREKAKQEIAERGSARPRKVVNISSTSGTRGNFGQANYAAAKAGVIGLTKTLAREWGPFNIQVNCAAFGLIDTRLTRGKETGEKIRQGEVEIDLGIPAALREDALKLIPMRRAGTAEEAAGAILFLASPLADYVSGQVLEVTGGM